MLKKQVEVKVDRLIIDDISVKEKINNYLVKRSFKEVLPCKYHSELIRVELEIIDDLLAIDIFAKDPYGVIISSKSKNFNYLISMGVAKFINNFITEIKKYSPNCSIKKSHSLRIGTSAVQAKIKYMAIVIGFAILLVVLLNLITPK